MTVTWDGPPRRSSVLRVVGVVVGTILLLVAGLQVLGRVGDRPSASGVPGPEGTPTSAGSVRTPSALRTSSGSPTSAAPSTSPEATLPNRSLTLNSAYAVDLRSQRVACKLPVRRAKPALPDAELSPYLRTVVRCLVKVYRQPLTAQGFTLAEPEIKVYRGTVKTPCGRFDQTGPPAYYCPTDQTIYWPATRDNGQEAYTFARIGYIALLAHEFGHHLQAETGMITDYGRFYATADTEAERNLLSRRLELQAQCFEGVFLTTVGPTINLSEGDRAELRRWHGFTGDEDPPSDRDPDHGSSAAQIRWLVRGLDGQDLSRCNTWSASKKAVK